MQDGEHQHEQFEDENVEPDRAALHPRQLARAARVREMCSERVRERRIFFERLTHLEIHVGAGGDLQHEEVVAERVGQYVGDAKAGVRVQVVHDESGRMRGFARGAGGGGPAEFETLPAGSCLSSVSILL